MPIHIPVGESTWNKQAGRTVFHRVADECTVTVESEMTVTGPEFFASFPANSLTVLRLPAGQP